MSLDLKYQVTTVLCENTNFIVALGHLTNTISAADQGAREQK